MALQQERKDNVELQQCYKGMGEIIDTSCLVFHPSLPFNVSFSL